MKFESILNTIIVIQENEFQMSSEKWRPFCLGLNALIAIVFQIVFTVMGTVFGPVMGMFFLGALCPRAGPNVSCLAPLPAEWFSGNIEYIYSLYHITIPKWCRYLKSFHPGRRWSVYIRYSVPWSKSLQQFKLLKVLGRRGPHGKSRT